MTARLRIAMPQIGRALRVYFALALVLVVMTVFFDWLELYFIPVPLVPYLVLVVLAARWAGIGAAVFTSLAALLLVDLVLYEPRGSFELGSRRMLQLVLVLLAGLLLGWLMDGLRTARERAEAAAEAERAALQDRDALLSVIAHDLRSPLTTIKARVQLAAMALKRQQPDLDSAQRSLDLVVPQVDRVNRLLDDLLATGRSDAGTLSVQTHPIDLSPLLAQAVERWRGDAPGNVFEIEVAPSLPVVADANRMEQVLDNLLANAAKYSPRGSVISLRGWIADGEARISVTDHGEGIPPEQQPYVFDRFYRRPEHRASRQPGLGLGLYITRELVTAQRGRVWVESEPGHGSTFHLALPLRTSETTLPAGAAQ